MRNLPVILILLASPFWAYGQTKDNYHMIVALDGSGDYTSIQDAIRDAKSFPYQRVIIEIKNGIYREKVTVPAWNPSVSLIGESREGTIIRYDDHFKSINHGRNSTFETATLAVEGNDFYATNLTIENTAGPVGQALALSLHADRVLIENCNLLGNQDTFYGAGEGFRQYIRNCMIEGTTDFIFGEATVFFENCRIHSKSDSFVTAASTPKGQEFGFVFRDCELTADEEVTEVYLGRPWRTWAKTVFIDCTLGSHILPEGWDNWSNPDAEKNALYAEYNSSGPGANPEKRVGWSGQLKKKEVKKYTVENIFGGKWYESLNH